MAINLINVIKYDGDPDGNPWLIYKCPEDNFVLGSQLIVNQGQEAIFFKGGKACDVFTAGTHTLKSGNLPLLNKLVNFPFGGKTPFAAEVYFINKTSKLDMDWGTRTPFQLEDPKYGLILSIRSFGTYGVRINDSRLFVSELVGALPNGSTIDHDFIDGYFNGLMMSRIKTVLSAFMIRQKISFLEVTAYLKELSEECSKEITREFERFGAEIVNFYIESINPPKEEFEKLRQYKEELALGSQFYQQRRSFDIMEEAAKNPGAGGMAAAGMGMGMGFGMAGGAMGMMNGMAQNLNTNPQGVPAQAQPAGEACPSCGAANPQGQKFCGSCGAPMKKVVKCPACGFDNPEGQKFCGSCGQKLANICPSCGAENEMGQKFCGGCGTKLG